MNSRLRGLIAAAYDRFIKYALKFGVVGIIGLGVDVAVFNMLRLGIFGTDHALSDPIGAKTTAVIAATIVTWFGNRYWTFRAHRRKNYLMELLEFSTVAAGGLGISLLCLWISHYVLGFTSLLADNIATNVVGLFLATTFRFLMYRYWVFGHHRGKGLSAQNREVEAAEAAIYEDEEFVLDDLDRPAARTRSDR